MDAPKLQFTQSKDTAKLNESSGSVIFAHNMVAAMAPSKFILERPSIQSDGSSGSIPLISANLLNGNFHVTHEEPVDIDYEEYDMNEEFTSRPSTEMMPVVSSKDNHQFVDEHL